MAEADRAESPMIAARSFDAIQLQTVDLQHYVLGQTWVPRASAEGASSHRLTRSLTRNALVRRFTVRVGARRADATTLANAGQVRLQPGTGEHQIIVVDFGMLRTVSGVGLVKNAPAITIVSLRAFKGDAFDSTDLYLGDDDGAALTARSSPGDNTFEVRTERVRLVVKTTESLVTIAASVWLQFPDLPSDLDLRINGGPPAWTAPGVVQPSTDGWDANTEKVVDLTEALAALTGNPRDPAPLEATIVLSSRTPGILTLAEEEVDVASLARVLFDEEEEEETTLVFEEEGVRELVLPVPAWVSRVQEVRLTLAATVPPERIIDPVGAPAALRSDGRGPAYDLVLDVDHAAAARLDAAAPLATLAAVRLPLRAGPDGAEVRVVLHEGSADGPARPVDGGTSKPVDLPPAAASAGDAWTSFALARPVKLDGELTYWAIVVVGRGGAAWSLGRFATAAATAPIRRGGAAGPWHALPDAMVGAATLGARIRVVGTARPDTPVAPLSIAVAGATPVSPVSATPSPKGVRVACPAGVAPSGPASAPSITLDVTSRMTGAVKVTAVDVVATRRRRVFTELAELTGLIERGTNG